MKQAIIEEVCQRIEHLSFLHTIIYYAKCLEDNEYKDLHTLNNLYDSLYGDGNYDDYFEYAALNGKEKAKKFIDKL